MHLSLGLAQPQASRLSGSWPQPSACRPEQAVLAHSQLTTQPCRLCPFAIQHDELVVCGWLRTRREEQLVGTTAVPLAVGGSRHGRTKVVLCVCIYQTMSNQDSSVCRVGQLEKQTCAVQICLAIYHGLIHIFHKEQYRNVTAVGYSAVIFGWMALLSARKQFSASAKCCHHC